MQHDPLGSVPAHAKSGHQVGAGLQFAAVILAFILAGRWLDVRLETDPWLLVAGAVLGFVLGFYSMYRQLVTLPEQRRRREREERS